ncbi:PLD nuclease N-terminal domain-containing protein [Leifsonia sp. fls2-241-R2A-40a]|uniref:PLD nuclease N-terminal domain-containing protein n=1 Tax=Leifsonia sp. fls2-241-R2A-40a TaxID=3040290 RepID=UPI00254E8B34|nr:PLD nuclease N-terminal domain-containing protein [Leifsonia sp. fls2-241-R2A-40a]
MLLVPLLALTLFVFALVDIILRPSDQVKHLPKPAWVFIVILLPLIGSILWFALGREHTASAPRRRVLRMPAPPTQARTAAEPLHADPSGTEAQLAALEREIEEAERDERIRRLEAEVRRRSEADEGATETA